MQLALSLLATILAVLLGGWLATRVIASQVVHDADTRLQDELRTAAGRLDAVLGQAQLEAVVLASSTRVQSDLIRQRLGDLARVAEENPAASFYRQGRLVAGQSRAFDLQSRAAVAVGGRELGAVRIATTPGRALLPLARPDVLLLTRKGRIVPGSGLKAASGQGLSLRPRHTADVSVGMKRLRALMLPLGGENRRFALVVATPRTAIDASIRHRQLLALLAVVSALAAVLLGGLLLVRRAMSRRARTHRDARTTRREALAVLGDALAATHEPSALLEIVLKVAVEATGATGGRLVEREDSTASTASPGVEEPLILPIAAGGFESRLLCLDPPPGGFASESLRLAESLALQASVALENAYLHQVIQERALTDDLTGLANRRHFLESLEGEIMRAQRFNILPAVVVADLDNFKNVNDNYGHAMGDEVLRSFARVMRNEVREIDLPARLGGEEFVILLPQTNLDGAVALAERMRSSLAHMQHQTPDGRALPVTASFGVALYEPSEGAFELLGAADDALYRAKVKGKNRVVTRRRRTRERSG